MKEPRVESNIYDLTGNLANAPADDGYPIAGAVFTPAGPIEKRKVLSQRDFIDTYLTSSTVLPTDNDSIKFIFKLLELNPVYIIRACPVSVLEGISSTGVKLLFDKSFSLLPSYKKLTLSNIIDMLSYFGITVPNGTGTPDVFYSESSAEAWETGKDYNQGDTVYLETDEAVYYTCKETHHSSENFSADAAYWVRVARPETGTRIGDKKSLDELFDGLLDAANAERFNPCLMASAPGYLSSRVPVSEHSANIGKYTEVKNAIRLCQAESDVVLDTISDPATVTERNYLSIDGYSYYFQGTGKLGVPKVDAPYAITSPNTIKSISREYFMLKVMAEADVVREGGFGRIGVQLGNGDSWGAVFAGCNVPGMRIIPTDDGTELAMTSNRYFVPSDLSVQPDYAEKFAYLAVKIADPKATIDAADEASDDEDYPVVYRYRLYTWGSGSIGSTYESDYDADIDAARNREIVAALFGVDVADIPWSNTDLFQIIRVSKTDSRISVSRFLSKVLDKIVNSEKTVEGGVKVQIYDSSNLDPNRAQVRFNGKLVLTTSEDNPMSSDFFRITTDTETNRNIYQYYISTDSDNEDYRKADFLSVTIDDTVYYTGNVQMAGGLPMDLTQVMMSEDPVTLDEFSSLLQYHAYVNQGLCVYEGAFVLPDIESEVSFSENLNLQESDPIFQATMDQFAIVQKFPASSSIFQFSFKKSEENKDILELELNYKMGTVRENWTMSFVPGVVNGYGIDQFYTRVSNEFFQVVNLAGDGNIGEIKDSYSSPYFGKSVGVPKYNVQYMKDAMQTLPEYEDGLYYYMLTDSGVIDPGYASVIQTLCSQLHSWYPVSLPNTTSTADLISFVGGAGINSYYLRMLAASDRMDIAGFSSVMPGSYKLIQSVLSLYRSQSNEFAPNYDIRNGSIGMSNPTQSFKKAAREKLLDYKIETLKGGIGTDYYINDNLTAQKSTSYMSENQNVLMTIVAVHECESIARSYKAELNTATTRKRLEDALNSAIQSRLFKGKAYYPYSYYAKCDASNNPLQVINNNQLVADIYAQFTPSAKVIILNHYIIPLDQQ